MRACLGALPAIASVIWRRPDLLVLATPLVIVAMWSAATRPGPAPVLDESTGPRTLREGEATAWRGDLSGVPELDLVVAGTGHNPRLERRPAGGAVTAAAVGGAAQVALALRARRWGRYGTEPVRVVAVSSWGAFRWEEVRPSMPLRVLPVPGVFDAGATLRPAAGLVGLHRSTRKGEGTELAGIRPFQAGDRLRRVNWPHSLRTGTLHVDATWADQDTHVALLVDASVDLRVGEGAATSPSSLDTTVRAAGAIAEHYVRQGERVSLRVFGGARSSHVPPGSGRGHLYRILDALASVEAPPHGQHVANAFDARSMRLDGDVLAIMLSPLVSSHALDRAVAIGRRGITVAVLDTLPGNLVADADSHAGLIWRIRLLERGREIRMVHQIGVPVIPWRGAGSLDHFLRDVARRAAAPRVRAGRR